MFSLLGYLSSKQRRLQARHHSIYPSHPNFLGGIPGYNVLITSTTHSQTRVSYNRSQNTYSHLSTTPMPRSVELSLLYPALQSIPSTPHTPLPTPLPTLHLTLHTPLHVLRITNYMTLTRTSIIFWNHSQPSFQHIKSRVRVSTYLLSIISYLH